jgi:hypothetical protein
MTSQQLINSDKMCVVELKCGEYWVRLALWFTHEFTGGDLVRVADGAIFSIEGTDELSASYRRANWISGVVSGSLFTFRALNIPRQHSVLTELSGRLRASDMEVLAATAVIAIAKLADIEPPCLPPEGWIIQTQVIDRRTPIASQAAQGETASLSRP